MASLKGGSASDSASVDWVSVFEKEPLNCDTGEQSWTVGCWISSDEESWLRVEFTLKQQTSDLIDSAEHPGGDSNDPSAMLLESLDLPLRIHGVFTKDEMISARFNPHYSLGVMAKMIEAAVKNETTETIEGTMDQRGSSYVFRITERGFADIDHELKMTEYQPSTEEQLSYSKERIKELMQEVWQLKHTLSEKDVWITAVIKSGESDKERISKLSNKLEKIKQVAQDMQEQLEIKTLKTEELQNELETMNEQSQKKAEKIEQMELNELRMREQIDNLQNDNEELNTQLTKMKIEKTELIETKDRLTKDIGDMVANRRSIRAQMDRLNEWALLFSHLDRTVQIRSEFGRVLTHARETGRWASEYHCAYVNGICYRGMMSMEFKIERSRYAQVCFGVVQESESRTNGRFGEPILGVGYKASNGSLRFPPSKRDPSFAKTSGSGEVIRVTVHIESDEKASVTFSKNGGIPLGDPVSLAGKISWSEGLKFAVITVNKNDSVRIVGVQ